MFLNFFRNVLFPQQMFLARKLENTVAEAFYAMFPQQCILVCGGLKGSLSRLFSISMND